MRPTQGHLAALMGGVELEDGFARAEAAEVLGVEEWTFTPPRRAEHAEPPPEVQKVRARLAVTVRIGRFHCRLQQCV